MTLKSLSFHGGKYMMITKRLLELVLLGCMMSGSALCADEKTEKRHPEFLIPGPAGPWTRATRIVGRGDAFYNDFCLIQDQRGLWHCIGIHRPETTMFHAVSESLTRPFRFLENVESGDPAVTNMWAPFAVWQNQQRSLLYYCHSNDGMNVDKFSLRMLLADAPGLEKWRPYRGDRLAEGNIVFRQSGDRDACIFWDDGLDAYIQSEDPLNFGDAARDRITEQSGHAPEIVIVDGIDYIACCSIATKTGGAPGQHDLSGIYVQELVWRPASRKVRVP